MYLFNENTLYENIVNIGKAFHRYYGNTYAAYSFKTNYLADICQIVNEAGLLAEVVSPYERMYAMELGFTPDRIVYKDANEDFTFDCYVCKDQSKVSGTAITEDYVKQEGLTLTFPKDNTSWRWQYIEDTSCGDIEWPTAVNASGSGVGCKAGFRCIPAASGVRAGWCFGDLDDGGFDGVACRYSNLSVGDAYWFGSLGAPDIAG